MMALPGSTMRKYTTALTFTDTLSRVITSCFGTSSTMTRRSTLRICCTIGATRMRPGPLMPVKRPRVNMTPRSYSFSTLTVVKKTAPTKAMTTRKNGMNFSLASNRLDPESETFDLDDANLLTDAQRRRGVRVPQLARVTHLTLLIEVFDDFGPLTHHYPLTGDDRAALRAA